PGPAGAPPGVWRARGRASLDRLEPSYGGLLPTPNIPQPPAGPTPDFASLARAQLDAGLAARGAAPPAVPRATLPPYRPTPRVVTPPPAVEEPPALPAVPLTGDADRGIGLGPPVRPTGDADLGIGLEPVPPRPTGDADLGIGLEPPPAAAAVLAPPPPPPAPTPEPTNPFERVGRALVDALKGVPDFGGAGAAALPGGQALAQPAVREAVGPALEAVRAVTPTSIAARTLAGEEQIATETR